MEISFENDENRVIAHVKGEINSSTAKEFEEALNDNVSITDDLVIDFGEITYISSAGLRVLIMKQKEMSKLGSMMLSNVNDQIFDILKTVMLDKILTIEGREEKKVKKVETLEAAFDAEDYGLNDDDISLLPPRVYHLYTEEKLRAVCVNDNDDVLGFAVYKLEEDDPGAYIFYIHVREDAQGKGVEESLVKKIQEYTADAGVKDLYLVALNDLQLDDLAARLGFTKTNRTNYILRYNKKQILSSPIWKQIDKLRTMFDCVKIYDELDFYEQTQLEEMMDPDDFEDIDRLFARIYVSNDEILGMLNAQEVTDNNIWISKVTVAPSKEANRVPVIMLASFLDAVMALLGDDDLIQVVNTQTSMMESFKQVLGKPLETTHDTVFIKNN